MQKQKLEHFQQLILTPTETDFVKQMIRAGELKDLKERIEALEEGLGQMI